MSGGNETLYQSLLVKLSTEYEGAAQQIRDFRDRGENDAAIRLVHSIRGAAGNLGATHLQDAAELLETALRNDGVDVPDVLDRFANEISSVVKAVRARDFGVDGDSSDSVPYTREEPLEIIRELRDHLERRKPIPAKELILRLGRLELGTELQTELHEVSQLLNKYRFDDAHEVLARLTASLEE